MFNTNKKYALKLLQVGKNHDIVNNLCRTKAGMRHAFSVCVYCMRLRFHSNYVGWLNPMYFFENATACSKCTLKTRVATQLKASYKALCVRYVYLTRNRSSQNWVATCEFLRAFCVMSCLLYLTYNPLYIQ